MRLSFSLYSSKGIPGDCDGKYALKGRGLARTGRQTRQMRFFKVAIFVYFSWLVDFNGRRFVALERTLLGFLAGVVSGWARVWYDGRPGSVKPTTFYIEVPNKIGDSIDTFPLGVRGAQHSSWQHHHNLYISYAGPDITSIHSSFSKSDQSYSNGGSIKRKGYSAS